MVGIEQLRKIINKRPTIIMLHGKSIENFIPRMDEIKDLNICYTSLNYFDLIEDKILKSKGKKLSFVLESSGIVPTQVVYYNKKVRVPRLKKYLSRSKENLWFTTNFIVELLKKLGCEGFVNKYKEQTILVDKEIGFTLDVANSAVLLIGLCVIGLASKIVICGLDGYTEDYNKNIESYCFSKESAIDRSDGCGQPMHNGIIKDTINFEKTIIGKIKLYSQTFNVKIPEIVNCSSISVHKVFPKITYEELKKWLT